MADSNEICDVPQSIERPSVRETRKTQARVCPHRFPDHKCRRHGETPKTNRCVVLRGKWKELVGKIPGYRALSFPQPLAGIHRRRGCPRRQKFPDPSFSPLDLTRPRQVWDSNPINSDSWCLVRDLRFPPYIPIPAGGGLQRMAARIRACLSARMYSTSATVSFLSGEARGGRDEDRHLFTRTMLVNDTLIS